MMDYCRAAGLDPLICASYRTMEKQEALFEDKEAAAEIYENKLCLEEYLGIN